MKMYCIPKMDQLDEFYHYAKEHNLAFEYNDFFVPQVLMDEGKIQQLIEIYKSLDRDRSEDTLHGAFLDIVVNSEDPEIYAISRKRVCQCMDIARQLGVKAVVFHTNYITNFRLEFYRNCWLERNECFWREMLALYPDMMIYIENMFDESPDMLRELACRMEGEERFGVCLDLAHAYISGTAVEEWVTQLAPYIKHIHVNDNNGTEDSHLPIGAGAFPWEKYKAYMKQLPGDVTALIEVRSIEALKASFSFMREQGFDWKLYKKNNFKFF